MKIAIVTDFLSTQRGLAAALVIASAGILAFAYISQYVFHYDPCVLCLYQRKPYFVVIALGISAFLLSKKKPLPALGFLYLCGIAFLTGAGIAGYHTGVEQEWWAGTQTCGDSQLPMNASIEELKEYLRNKRITRCDVPSWKLFGFSMTNYNFMQSVVLAGLTFYFCGRIHKKR